MHVLLHLAKNRVKRFSRMGSTSVAQMCLCKQHYLHILCFFLNRNNWLISRKKKKMLWGMKRKKGPMQTMIDCSSVVTLQWGYLPAVIDLDNVEGISVDWIGNNLYWTNDGYRKTISVARLERASQTRKTLLEGDMSHPRAIVVDPIHWYVWNLLLWGRTVKSFYLHDNLGLSEY